MCQRITCRDCGKPSFAGCGRHVESVLGDVPEAKRCCCQASKGASTGSDGPSAGFSKLLDFVRGGRKQRRS